MPKDKPKMSFVPPSEKDREDFLNEPDRKRSFNGEMLPWEEPGVSDRVIKSFNIRFPEPLLLKIKYLVDEKNFAKSAHRYCYNIIKKQVDRDLADLK